MKLVVGLGNPGSQYARTRHNIGWRVVDRIADRAGWDGRGRQRDASNVVGGRYRSLDLTLVKPLTYMNESGLAVRKVLARERAPLTDLLVVADDFALPFGKLRFREGGGAGGHNGLRSIIDELGTEKFSRLRVGIGEPDRDGDRPRPVDLHARRGAPGLTSSSMRPPTRSRRGRAKARTRRPTASTCSSFGRPTRRGSPPPGEIEGPPDADGIRRTRTGWRRIRPAKPDA